MQYFIYDLFHPTPMQPRLAGGNHAVSKHGTCHVFDIVRDDIRTPVYGCISLGRSIEGQRATWTDTQFNAIMYMRCSYQFNDIAFNRRLYAHPANHHLRCLEPFA